MSNHKRVFTAPVITTNENGETEVVEKEFAVIKPGLNLVQQANKLRNKIFNELFEDGGLLRQQVESELEARDLWNNKLQAKYDELQGDLIINVQKLEGGGIKLSEARDIAIEIARQRQELVSMLVSRSDLDQITCEGQADSEKFNFLFANCLVYNETEELFYPNGLEDYVKDMENPVAVKGATEFYYLVSNSESLDDQLPENKFLKKYKFVNEDMQYLERSTGRRITEDGKYIDENGYFIEYNKDGTTYRVNRDGEKISEVEEEATGPAPFLDDDGTPLDEDGNRVEIKKTTRKRRATKAKKTETESVDTDA